jgi:hypothetical protein
MLLHLIVAPLLMVMALLQAQPPAGMRTLDQGTISSVATPKQEVLRTSEAFTTLWQSHQRRRVVPRVDFDKEMVVAIFQGSQPTAGYKVEIVSVQEEGGAPVVRYREEKPGGGEVAAQIVTAPYHIVAVPRIEGAPRFERVEK